MNDLDEYESSVLKVLGSIMSFLCHLTMWVLGIYFAVNIIVRDGWVDGSVRLAILAAVAWWFFKLVEGHRAG